MKIEDAIKDLALQVAERAKNDATPFADKLDAVGKLTTSLGLIQKHKGKGFEDRTDEHTMGELADQLKDHADE